MSQSVRELRAPASSAEPKRVLIVERDPDSERMLSDSLACAGFTVTLLGSGEDAIDAIDRDRPHLIMLDWEYPGVVPGRLIQHLSNEEPSQRARLVALSQFSGERQAISCLEQGVDDFVVRPYSLPVLVARVRAVLRSIRKASDELEIIEFHRLGLAPKELRLMVDERIVPLRPMEFRLLAFLIRHPERVFTRQYLLTRVWGGDTEADERAVDVNIQRIRKALTEHGCGEYLQTVRSFGYRLSAPRP